MFFFWFAYFYYLLFVNFRKSLDLVEILLHLSESCNYEIVLKLFAWPVKNCPDILVLTLLQVQVSAELPKKVLLRIS